MPSYVRRFVTGTNYCGPGGFGRTLGAVDAACEAHDASYTAPYMFDYFKSQKADKVFLQSLSYARPVGVKQYMTKYLARRYFDTKTKLHDMVDGVMIDPNQGYQFKVGKKRAPQRSVVLSNKRYGVSVPALPANNPRHVFKTRRVAAPPLPWYRSRRITPFTRRFRRRQPFRRVAYRRRRR